MYILFEQILFISNYYKNNSIKNDKKKLFIVFFVMEKREEDLCLEKRIEKNAYSYVLCKSLQ